MKTLPASLRQLMQVSHAMCEQANVEDWQTVAALHARFSRLLGQVFADEDTRDPSWATVIEELIENSRHVSELALKQREIAKEAMRHLRLTAPAARAYASVK